MESRPALRLVEVSIQKGCFCVINGSDSIVSTAFPIAAILSVRTGPHLDCSQMLRSAWGIALLKVPDLFIHRHSEATVSILFLIAAILSVITGPYLDCSKLLRSAWG